MRKGAEMRHGSVMQRAGRQVGGQAHASGKSSRQALSLNSPFCASSLAKDLPMPSEAPVTTAQGPQGSAPLLPQCAQTKRAAAVAHRAAPSNTRNPSAVAAASRWRCAASRAHCGRACAASRASAIPRGRAGWGCRLESACALFPTALMRGNKEMSVLIAGEGQQACAQRQRETDGQNCRRASHGAAGPASGIHKCLCMFP